MKKIDAQRFTIREVINDIQDGGSERSIEIESGLYGRIWIDNAADIITLKKVIDDYLNLTPRLITDYLRGYEPTGEPGKGVIMRTSSDIQNDLADMDDLSVSDIAEAMTALGYRAHFSESGSHGWLLRPITQNA